MTWAGRKKLMLALAGAVVIVIVLTFIGFKVLYQAPSCMDGKQNKDESGIDCGGSCSYLCTEGVRTPAVRFVRAFSPTPGRTDVIAYVDNPNRAAAVDGARYAIELHGGDGILAARKEGSVDLRPGSLAPIYFPNFFNGDSAGLRAFLTFDDESMKWMTYEEKRALPRYNNDAQIGEGATPRITATIGNPSATSYRDIVVVATVFDAGGNAMAASQTIVPLLTPQGVAGVTFVWNQPFPSAVGRIDIVPVLELP